MVAVPPNYQGDEAADEQPEYSDPADELCIFDETIGVEHFRKEAGEHTYEHGADPRIAIPLLLGHARTLLGHLIRTSDRSGFHL